MKKLILTILFLLFSTIAWAGSSVTFTWQPNSESDLKDIGIYQLKIGDEIDVQMGLELAKHFKLNYIIDRLEKHPEQYKTVIFDGCSCLPDELLGIFTGCKWKDITYLCCLPHDIAYAYTVPGSHNDYEKERVDLKFKSDLITKAGMRPWLAKIFHHAVRIGGVKELGMDFSWGFGRR